MGNIGDRKTMEARAVTVTKSLSLQAATRWDFNFSDVSYRTFLDSNFNAFKRAQHELNIDLQAISQQQSR